MLTATTASTASTAATSTASSSTSTSATDTTASQDRFLKLLVAQLNNQDPMNPMDNAQMTSQMAQINTVTGIQQVNDTAASQDRFLKLLVAQLNNQDPMNPMDNAQMTSQMAQINTVTGIQQVNDTLKSMAEQFSAMQVLQGSAMVGRTVLIESNTLTRSEGVASGAIDLAGKTDAVRVEILSPGGQLLDTLNLGSLDAGRHSFAWDASNYQGAGEPNFRVTASRGGTTIEATSLAPDRVLSVGSENGTMTVQLQVRGATAYNSIKAIL